jgi:2-phospho-L-lactate guanylyltransferase
MATVVVPFRGSDPKRRLAPVAEPDRVRLAEAMLADVLAAASGIGRLFVVAPATPALPDGVQHVADPPRGQGAAVRNALDAAVSAGAAAPYLVVNADLPCATPRDLLALAGALPEGGLAVAAAADGTTNALALSDAQLFEPLYGPGSAARFAALAPSAVVDAPNLVDDVDTLDDLTRLADRLGPHTRALYDALHLGRAA